MRQLVLKGMEKPAQIEQLGQRETIGILRESNYEFKLTNFDMCACFREVGKPKVDYFTTTGNWMIPGGGGLQEGGLGKFMMWYDKQTC